MRRLLCLFLCLMLLPLAAPAEDAAPTVHFNTVSGNLDISQTEPVQ